MWGYCHDLPTGEESLPKLVREATKGRRTRQGRGPSGSWAKQAFQWAGGCPAQPFPVPVFHLEASFIPPSLSRFIPACSTIELAPYCVSSISFSRHCVPFHRIPTTSNDKMFPPVLLLLGTNSVWSQKSGDSTTLSAPSSSPLQPGSSLNPVCLEPPHK